MKHRRRSTRLLLVLLLSACSSVYLRLVHRSALQQSGPAFAVLSSDFSTAVTVGGVCAAAQLIFYAGFAFLLPKGPWRNDPGFLAHQCVTLPLMLVMTLTGMQAWFAPGDFSEALEERVFGRNATGEYLAQVAFGSMVMWDIPTGLLTKSLRKADMMAHHFLMAFLAFLACTPLFSCYIPFYFGVIELSSVPLAIVDIFHPSQLQELTHKYRALRAINEVCRPCFALLFLLVRGLYFPYVMANYSLPDIWAMTRESESASQSLKYGIVLVSAVALTCLQLYWASLVVKQVSKALKG
eukprot:TRINITY_DN65267_c0_g1_i1.p1 TRINITY_DN65267_c0_g1~~TRINITY_DN65267_c0_g1_i1.p1  ORF type:complete len:296 (-),score=32.24 TRINITY_DN65267_c0_g1_i1:39-926(-)